MKLGIVGCGAIGSRIAQKVAAGAFPGLTLEALTAAHQEKAEALAAALACEGLPRPAPLELKALVERVDFVVEATSQRAMPAIARMALSAGKPLLAMSVGGLLDAPDLPDLARAHATRLYFPSGALGGLDAVLAAKEGGLWTVTLSTTKHPSSLQGAPYLLERGISLEGLKEALLLFEGTAREAIQGFPANANVAATLSCAGIGLERTRVRIVADPACALTRQEIIATGAAGNIHAVTEGQVVPDNPRTGWLAVLSALAVLRQFSGSVHIGN